MLIPLGPGWYLVADIHDTPYIQARAIATYVVDLQNPSGINYPSRHVLTDAMEWIPVWDGEVLVHRDNPPTNVREGIEAAIIEFDTAK